MNCLKFIPLVIAVAHHYGVDSNVAIKVMQAESSCNPIAISGAGDLGLFQIRRGITTRGYDDFTDSQLMSPPVNVRLGVRRLARAQRICGGAPDRWLGNYAGLKCGPSRYARRVLYGRNEYQRQEAPLSSVSSETSGFDYTETVDVPSERKR